MGKKRKSRGGRGGGSGRARAGAGADAAPTSSALELALARQRAARQAAAAAPAPAADVPMAEAPPPAMAGFTWDAARGRFFPGAPPAPAPAPAPAGDRWGDRVDADRRSLTALVLARAYADPAARRTMLRGVMRSRYAVAVGASASRGAPVGAAAASADGSLVAAAATDGRCYVGDGGGGGRERVFVVGFAASAVAFADGNFTLAAGDAGGAGRPGRVLLWDIASGSAPAAAALAAPDAVSTLWCLACGAAALAVGGGAGSRDGRSVGGCASIDRRTGAVRFRAVLASDALALIAVCGSDDDLLVGLRAGAVFRVDGRTGASPAEVLDGLDGPVTALAALDDRQVLVASKRGELVVADARVPGRRLLSLARPRGFATSAGVVLDGARRFCAAAGARGVVRAWSLADGAVIAEGARPADADAEPALALGVPSDARGPRDAVLPTFAFLGRRDGAVLRLTARPLT